MASYKSNIEKLVAYDYAAQEWVVGGTRAKELLVAQTREELELLEGPRGEAFLRSLVGSDGVTIERAVREKREELSRVRMMEERGGL
jgi:hypothetical protein